MPINYNNHILLIFAKLKLKYFTKLQYLEFQDTYFLKYLYQWHLNHIGYLL